MADKKISALTSASTPLAGTEVLPIVQSGATVKVPVSDLTAGRAIAATSITVGNARTRLASTYVADVPGPTGNNTGILFGGNTIFPCDGNGSLTNGVASLGTSSYQWYDIFLANNVVIGTSGKGIDFSATPGTGTSELLNDYEEGTYTPTWNGGSITTVVSAYYTKIGRQVTVIADVILGTSASASVSEITVPFTALSASNWGSGGVAYTTYGATLFVSFDATTSKINFRATANTAALTCAGVATSRFAFTLTYFV